LVGKSLTAILLVFRPAYGAREPKPSTGRAQAASDLGNLQTAAKLAAAASSLGADRGTLDRWNGGSG